MLSHIVTRKRRIFLVVGLALTGLTALAVLIMALWRPDLEWYVTAPLDKAGHRGRVLVPRGWEIDIKESTLPTGNMKDNDSVRIMFTSKPNEFKLWIRRMLRQPVSREFVGIEFAPRVGLFGLDASYPADGRIEVMSPNRFQDGYTGVRVIKTGKPALFGDVVFLSYDKRTFDRLHSVVCKSFEILPGK